MSFVYSLLALVLNIDSIGIIFLILSLLMVWYVNDYVKSWRLPPGPPRLPLLGASPFVNTKNDFWIETQRLSKKYESDILSLDIYGLQIILLQTYELAKEAFHKRQDMTNRSQQNFFQILEPGYAGIISSSGTIWRDHRRFTLYMLRDFGMRKIAAEQTIQYEAAELCKRVDKLALSEEMFDPQSVIEPAVANVICSLVLGKRYDVCDEEFNSVLHAVNYMLKGFSSAYSRISSSPYLWWLVPLIFPTQYRETRKQYSLYSEFIRRIIKEHREKFDGSVSDLIDGYFVEQQKDTNFFTDVHLRYLIQDLFLAGSETTTTTLRWALLYLLKYPEIQEKIYEELALAIGDRAPGMADKKNTPYTEAYLLEVQRYNTIVPNAVDHTSTGDIEFRGYKIPSGAFILSNLAVINRDPRVFVDPDTFKVDRFLDNGKVVNADKVNQFGVGEFFGVVGRRICAGEALARMEVYLFFVTIILQFRMETAEPDRLKLNGSHWAGIYAPEPYMLIMERRRRRMGLNV